MRSRTLLAVLALLAAILAACSPAHAYELRDLLQNRLDPRAAYRTLSTPHFEVHYPQDLEEVAGDVAITAERVHERLTRALGIEAEGSTHLVIAERSDDPGIFTFVHPQPQIFLDIALPPLSKGLNDYQSWHDWLVSHEYTHVLHMGLRRGIYRSLSPIFGSWLRPGQTAPPWLTEGLAVYDESVLTPKGRGNSSLYAMMIRAAQAEGLLEDHSFVAKDTIGAFDNKAWPWSIRPYLFGYYLTRTVAEKSPDSIRKLLLEAAASTPYRLDPALKAAGFASFDELWDMTMSRLRADSERDLALLRKKPLTELEYLTHTGNLYYGLSISPDGQNLVVTRDQPEIENAILRFRLDGDSWKGPDELLSRNTGFQSSFSRSSRFLLYDETARVSHHYLVSDIAIYDLKKGEVISASPDFHAREADVHPDGKHVVFVRNERGRNELWMTDTAWGNPVPLLTGIGYRRISGPRFSPDGNEVAVSVHNEKTGGEDIWLVDSSGARVLLADGAENTAVSWTPDGKRILFSSDQGGVFDVHAIDLTKNRRYRLSHVVGGLFYPVVDPAQKWVYAISYRARGYDVARFRWNPETWKDEGAVKPASFEPDAPVKVAQTLHSEPYRGLHYLWPQYLRPSFAVLPGSIQIGGEFGAVDPLFLQYYEADLRYDTATHQPVGRLFYFNGTLPSALDWTTTHDAVPQTTNGNRHAALLSELSANVPLTESGTHFHLRPGVFFEAVTSTVTFPYAGAHLGLRYETQYAEIGQSFPETGSLLDLDLRQLAYLGSSSDFPNALNVTARTHVALGSNRQALHLGFQGGAFFQGSPEVAFYSAGGRRSFPYSLGRAFTLYGYEPARFSGPRLAVAEVLYSRSLWDIERGFGTVPIFLGRLSAALRLQAAAVDTGRSSLFPWSGGIEAYQGMLLGHLFDLTARLGVYRGASATGGEYQALFTLGGSGSDY